MSTGKDFKYSIRRSSRLHAVCPWNFLEYNRVACVQRLRRRYCGGTIGANYLYTVRGWHVQQQRAYELHLLQVVSAGEIRHSNVDRGPELYGLPRGNVLCGRGGADTSRL